PVERSDLQLAFLEELRLLHRIAGGRNVAGDTGLLLHQRAEGPRHHLNQWIGRVAKHRADETKMHDLSGSVRREALARRKEERKRNGYQGEESLTLHNACSGCTWNIPGVVSRSCSHGMEIGGEHTQRLPEDPLRRCDLGVLYSGQLRSENFRLRFALSS